MRLRRPKYCPPGFQLNQATSFPLNPSPTGASQKQAHNNESGSVQGGFPLKQNKKAQNPPRPKAETDQKPKPTKSRNRPKAETDPRGPARPGLASAAAAPAGTRPRPRGSASEPTRGMGGEGGWGGKNLGGGGGKPKKNVDRGGGKKKLWGRGRGGGGGGTNTGPPKKAKKLEGGGGGMGRGTPKGSFPLPLCCWGEPQTTGL